MEDQTLLSRPAKGFSVSNKATVLEHWTVAPLLAQSKLNLHISRHNLQAVCIQEYRLLHKNTDPSILNHDIGHSSLFTASAYKITNNATVRGVGITVRKQILSLLTSIKKVLIIFIDFKKAFDSIDRSKMFKILAAYGILLEIVNEIRMMYENTSALV